MAGVELAHFKSAEQFNAPLIEALADSNRTQATYNAEPVKNTISIYLAEIQRRNAGLAI